MRKILSKMVENGYDWYDIKDKYSYTLKYLIEKYLRHKMRKLVLQKI